MKKYILLISFANIIYAGNYIDSISLSIGKSKESIKIYRLSAKKEFKAKWFQSSYGYISGYYESSFNYFNGKNSIYGFSISPVFAYYFNTKLNPFIEAGIGASYFNKKHINSRDLSTNFLFENRIGVGARYKNLEFSFRFMHYSNGGIKKPNDGIDIWIGAVSYRF